jgi:hypothetical protein
VVVRGTKEAVVACKRVVDVLARTRARRGQTARIVGAHIVVIAVVIAVARDRDGDRRTEGFGDIGRLHALYNDGGLHLRLTAFPEAWEERDLTGPAADGLELDRADFQPGGGGASVRAILVNPPEA